MIRAGRVGLGLLLATLTGPVLAAQQGKPAIAPAPTRDGRPAPAPSGTAVITGTIVAADTGRPVRRVHVTLSGATPSLTLTATTADDGAFTFTNLPAGTFTLTAARPGFVESVFGEKRAGSGRPGTPIELIDGQRLDRVSVAIARGGVLAGTITDDHGEPEVGARVRVLRWVLRTGERTLVAAGTANTDDRGMYRVAGLLPGDYVVSATSTDVPTGDSLAVIAKAKAEATASGDLVLATEQLKTLVAALTAANDPSRDLPTGYGPVFFPGTTQPAAAMPVTLGVSEERGAIDLALALVPLVRVSGVVTGGPATALLPVTLTPVGTPPGLVEARMARLAADGSFSFAGVPPGAYTVFAATASGLDAVKANAQAAKAGLPGPPVLWASADVVIEGHPVAPLALVLEPGLTLAGRLVPPGTSAPPDLSRVRVGLAAAIAGSPEGAVPVAPAGVDPTTGRFTVTGLVPGRYRLNVSGLPGPWRVASAVLNGPDVMDRPLEVRDSVDGIVVALTDRSTTLSGRLEDTGGRPTSDFTVVVFPADQTFWLPQARRIQATRPTTDGRYAFHGLPPGDYRLVLVSDVEPGQWFDPDWLRGVLPSALALTLADGQTVTQDVRVR